MKNLQGDVVQIRSVYGTVVVEYTYDAWGNVLSITGLYADTLGQNNPIRYRGYYQDFETGFYYLQSRYYDPAIRRFINADNAISGIGENALGYNMFVYCMNNPVNLSDSTGNWPSWATKLVAAVAVVADSTGNWPSWATKLVAAVAVVAVVAVAAAITVATAGAGTAAAVIAVGAAKGAAVGMVSGAAVGAAGGAISHRVSTGSWEGAGEAALNGMGDGALSGAITGAVTGAAGSAVKVRQAAKAFDNGTFKSGYQSMKYHYNKHVVQEQLNKSTNILQYADDAINFSNRNASVLKYTYNYNYSNASWNLTYSSGKGGMYTSVGKIISFWYNVK